MKYSVFVTLKKLWNKKFVYLVVVIQISFGIYLLSSALDDFYVNRLEYNKAKEKISEHSINIVAKNDSSMNDINFINVNDYKFVKKKYSDSLDIMLIKSVQMHYDYCLEQNKFDWFNINLVFIDDGALGFTFDDNEAYLSEETEKIIRVINGLKKKEYDGNKIKVGEYFDSSNIKLGYKDGFLKIGNKPFKIKRIEKNVGDELIDRSIGWHRDTGDNDNKTESIFISISEYDDYRQYINDENDTNLSWMKLIVNTKDINTSHLYDMITELSEFRRGEVTYTVDSMYLNLKETFIQKLTETMKRMVTVFFQLLLVSISSTSIIYLIILKRIKSIAVSIMLGSTKRKQIFELLLEVYIVTFLGVFIGVLYYYLVNISSGNVMYGFTWILVILTGVVIGVLSSSLSLIGIKKLTPIEILQRV